MTFHFILFILFIKTFFSPVFELINCSCIISMCFCFSPAIPLLLTKTFGKLSKKKSKSKRSSSFTFSFNPLRISYCPVLVAYSWFILAQIYKAIRDKFCSTFDPPFYFTLLTSAIFANIQVRHDLLEDRTFSKYICNAPFSTVFQYERGHLQYDPFKQPYDLRRRFIAGWIAQIMLSFSWEISRQWGHVPHAN